MAELAEFLWEELKPSYFEPLTPYPSDRIYGDIKVDPDDISDIALRFEKRFDAWLGEVPIKCPDDPTIAEFAAVLQSPTGLRCDAEESSDDENRAN